MFTKSATARSAGMKDMAVVGGERCKAKRKAVDMLVCEQRAGLQQVRRRA